MSRLRDSWRSVPFWSLFSRGKVVDHPNEELLSVFRDLGVIRRSEGEGNRNRVGGNISSYQLVEPGDLVVNKMKAWQGSLGVSELRGIVSPAYFVYRPQSVNHGRFLHYALRSAHYIEWYKQVSQGVRPDQWDLQPERLAQMYVSLPPLDTQCRIADFLDRETAEIDAMDTDLDRLIETLQERRSAFALQTLFPLGVPSDLTSRAEFNALGYKYPRRIDSMTEARNERNEDHGAQYLSLMRGKGIIRYEEKGDVGNKKPQDLTRCKVVRSGDYVLNSMNFGIGSYGISPLNGVVSNVYLVFTPDKAVVDDRYLHYIFFSDDFRQRVQDLGNGILEHRKSIPWDRFRSVHVPLPPLKEQRHLVAHLDRETAEIDSMIADARRLKEVLAERRQVLISDVVTGRKEVPA